MRTRAISRLYSIAPRRSALGVACRCGQRAASAITSSVGCLPVEVAFGLDGAQRRRAGVGEARCRRCVTSPPPPRVSCTAVAAVAKSPTLRSSLT